MYEIDQAERERIKAEFKAIGARPLPKDRKPVGCGLLLLIPPILMIGPRLPRPAAIALAIASAVIALTGAYLTLFGSRSEQVAMGARARKGLDNLTRFDTLTPDERRTSALYALVYAQYANGPISFPLYDATEEAARLPGDALEYVKAVEAVLVADSKMQPVFTS